MSTEKQRKNRKRDEGGSDWWDTTPLGSARRRFREQLKDPRSDADHLAWTWLQYYGVANIHGTTRQAARCFPSLMDMRRSPHELPLVERLSRDPLAALMLIGFRACIALAEFADAPIHLVMRSADLTQQVARRYGVHENAFAFLRMALSIRTATASAHESDFLLVRDAWRATEHEEGGDEKSMGCESGRAAILVEWLLHVGRYDEAIALADDAAKSDPCIGPCGLAPQTMLALLLEPLARMNRRKARTVLKRLAAAAPLGRAWLLPAGCRIAALGAFGDLDEAFVLYDRTHEFAQDREVSTWQRLHFHRGVSVLFRHAKTAKHPRWNPDAATSINATAAALAAAMDERNGSFDFSMWRNDAHLKP